MLFLPHPNHTITWQFAPIIWLRPYLTHLQTFLKYLYIILQTFAVSHCLSPNLRNYPKICDQNFSQLFFRVKCWDAFLVFTQSSNNQHYGILIYSHIISLELPTRAVCFSFESTHNCSKDLSRKQKFKHLSVSLARGHQKIEYCNFIKNQLTPDSRLLFATGKKFSLINWWKIVRP